MRNENVRFAVATIIVTTTVCLVCRHTRYAAISIGELRFFQFPQCAFFVRFRFHDIVVFYSLGDTRSVCILRPYKYYYVHYYNIANAHYIIFMCKRCRVLSYDGDIVPGVDSRQQHFPKCLTKDDRISDRIKMNTFKQY